MTRGGVEAGPAEGLSEPLAGGWEKVCRFWGKLGVHGPRTLCQPLNNFTSSPHMQTSNAGSRVHLTFNPD